MKKTTKERGVFLTVWLVLMLVANAWAVLVNFVVAYLLNSGILMNSAKELALVYSQFPIWIFYLSGIGGIINIILIIFLFMWKKWAFFVLCGLTGIYFIINLAIGAGIFMAIFGLTGIVILYLIIRPKWKLFN